MTDAPRDDHLGDVLSALLDGELAAGEAAAARAHVAACESCAAELVAVGSVRDALRALPVVEPPAGFVERLGSAPRPARRGALAAAVAAAAAVAVLFVAPARPEPVRPAVADRVADHAATASVAVDPVSQLVPAGVPVRFEP